MSIIYGGQDNNYNYHYTGFYFEFLEEILLATNYCNITIIKEFGLLYDTSYYQFFEYGEISLNIEATVCK